MFLFDLVSVFFHIAALCMFKFLVVAARLFLVFCVCLNFDNLAKLRRKIFGRVSEVGENDSPVYSCRLCIFLLVFFSLL